MKIGVEAEDGSPVQAVAKLSLRSGESLIEETDADGTLSFQSGSSPVAIQEVEWLAIQPVQPGYRSVLLDRNACQGRSVVLPALPSHPKPWWLNVLGLVGNPDDGEGIRIGVIDGPRCSQDGLHQVSSARGGSAPRVEPRSHASAVCTLLCAVAPKATVIHADVTNGTKAPQFNATTSAVHEFVADHAVDLLSLSLGTPYAQGLADALWYARDSGVVTVVAGGNNGGTSPSFPASMAECVAVGALGRQGASPPSLAAYYESKSAHTGVHQCVSGVEVGLYHWSDSNEGVDYAAPGVVEVRGFDFAGTSFAAPLVTGVIAAMLNRQELDALPTSDRAQHVLDALADVSQQVPNLPPAVVGAGLPVL